MKTIPAQIFLCGLLLGSIFILSNCKDNCSDKKIYLKDLNTYVPYTGKDTLRFLRNSTDTQIFVGQGLERFYVTTKEQEDDACPVDHESVRIRFKNLSSDNYLKIEYYYDYDPLGNTYRFLYNETDFGPMGSSTHNNFKVNGQLYNNVGLFTKSTDTLTYLAFRLFEDNSYRGILKIKYPGDTLTFIR